MTSIKAIVRGFAQIFLKIKMYNDNGWHATKRNAKLGYKNMLYEHLTKCLNIVHTFFFYTSKVLQLQRAATPKH